MKLQLKINLEFDDLFEKKILSDIQNILGPEFRKQFLGYLGFLLKVSPEDKAVVNSFIVKKLPNTEPEDEDIKNDISGAAK